MATTAMDVLKLLERSNCRECGLPTCLAFAAEVVKGRRPITDCPRLPGEVGETLRQGLAERRDEPEGDDGGLEELKAELRRADLAAVAERLGGRMVEGRLALHCLGRVFFLDGEGELASECHVNHWVHAPILDYAARGVGREPAGDWAHFGELPGSKDWLRYFEYRCEARARDLVGEHPALFRDIVDIFGAREPEGPLAARAPRADWCAMLLPLPKVPILLCYWESEGELEAQLEIYFDRSASANLGIGSLYALVSGVVEMLWRIIRRHTHKDR